MRTFTSAAAVDRVGETHIRDIRRAALLIAALAAVGGSPARAVRRGRMEFCKRSDRC